MATKLEIINKILIKLGCETVDNLNTDTKPCRLINEVYDYVKQRELQKHNWIFAKKQTTLIGTNNEQADTTFKKKFELPIDCLLLLEIAGFGAVATQPYQYGANKLYDLAGRYIFTNKDKITIDYIADIDDSKLDVNFIDVFCCAVAFEIAEVITQSDQKVKTLYEKYLLSVKTAKRINVIGQPAMSVSSGVIERSRI